MKIFFFNKIKYLRNVIDTQSHLLVNIETKRKLSPETK